MEHTSYSEKLKSPKWQRKRLEVLSRDRFTCQYCGDTETELHVHHTRYKKRENPINTSPQYLLTLCKYCHFNTTFLIGEAEMGLYHCFMKAETDEKKRQSVRNHIYDFIIKEGRNIKK